MQARNFLPTSEPRPTTCEQVRASVALLIAVSETIREADTVPAGPLYAALMDRLTLAAFEKLLATLKAAGLVEESPAHLLRWIGPAIAKEATR